MTMATVSMPTSQTCVSPGHLRLIHNHNRSWPKHDLHKHVPSDVWTKMGNNLQGCPILYADTSCYAMGNLEGTDT